MLHSRFWGMIACKVTNNSPELAAIYLPELNDHAVCQKGKGVFLNGKKISSPAPVSNLSPFFYGEALEIEDSKLRKFVSHSVLTIEMLKCGGIFKYSASIWEYYAMILFIKELGGMVYDYNGNIPMHGSRSMNMIGSFIQELFKKVILKN